MLGQPILTTLSSQVTMTPQRSKYPTYLHHKHWIVMFPDDSTYKKPERLKKSDFDPSSYLEDVQNIDKHLPITVVTQGCRNFDIILISSIKSVFNFFISGLPVLGDPCPKFPPVKTLNLPVRAFTVSVDMFALISTSAEPYPIAVVL